MRRPFTNLLNRVRDKITNFVQKRYARKSESLLQDMSKAQETNWSRMEPRFKIQAWCRAFNKRNGYVVPKVSPESIARKAMRLPARHPFHGRTRGASKSSMRPECICNHEGKAKRWCPLHRCYVADCVWDRARKQEAFDS